MFSIWLLSLQTQKFLVGFDESGIWERLDFIGAAQGFSGSCSQMVIGVGTAGDGTSRGWPGLSLLMWSQGIPVWSLCMEWFGLPQRMVSSV